MKQTEKLLNLIIHPTSIFQYIRDANSKFWITVAIVASIAIWIPILVSAPIQSADAQELFQQQMKDNPSVFQGMTAEQQEQALQATSNPLFIVILPGLGALAGLWLGWLIWSGTLHFLSTMIGGQNQLRHIWQIVVISSFPFIIGYLLQGAFIFTSGQLIENPGLSGLVADHRPLADIIAAPPSPAQVALRVFLTRIDLYVFWNLLLLILGTATVALISRKKATILVISIWVVFSILMLIPPFISSIIANQLMGA